MRLLFVAFTFACSLFAGGEPLAHLPFIVVSPPKSGTHLLGKTLCLLLNKPMVKYLIVPCTKEALQTKTEEAVRSGGFLVTHCLPDEECINLLKERGYLVVFMQRDPRDQLISRLFWTVDTHHTFELKERAKFLTLSRDDQIEELITGRRFGFRCVEIDLVQRLPWLLQKSDFLLPVHFEKLVGNKGGGRDDSQLKELRRIAQFLQVDISEADLKKVGLKIFGNTWSFKNGQIGSWKTYFRPKHKRLFKQKYQGLLEKLGYEKKSNW